MSDLVKRLRDDPGLADCEEAANRIEALEARVAAADKLAGWAEAISERKVSPATGGRLILERDIVGLETALAAYEATKEQSDA